jgi:hypothetical protein
MKLRNEFLKYELVYFKQNVVVLIDFYFGKQVSAKYFFGECGLVYYNLLNYSFKCGF